MFTKPLAILKDSLREAWDSKTLLVMLVLAFLFLIGVASIGYEPAAPRAVFDRYAEELSAPVVRLERGKHRVTMVDRRTGVPYPHPTFTVTTFKTLKEGGHAATGEHEFTVVVKTEDPKPPEEAKEPDPKKKDAPPDEPGDIFEKYVAAWHDTEGNLVRLEDRKDIDPRKWRLVAPVTDDMVREFF